MYLKTFTVVTSFKNSTNINTLYLHSGTQYANEATIVNPRVEVPGGILVIVDGYLFPDELYNASTPAALLALTSEESSTQATTIKIGEPGLDSNSTFLENVSQVLSFLKSGVRVFQHFLSRSNVSQHLRDSKFILSHNLLKQNRYFKS